MLFWTIDGKGMGRFRIEKEATFDIERPSQDALQFEFHPESSQVSQKAGVKSGSSANGLIQVEFCPEKLGTEKSIAMAYTLDSLSMQRKVSKQHAILVVVILMIRIAVRKRIIRVVQLFWEIKVIKSFRLQHLCGRTRKTLLHYHYV